MQSIPTPLLLMLSLSEGCLRAPKPPPPKPSQPATSKPATEPPVTFGSTVPPLAPTAVVSSEPDSRCRAVPGYCMDSTSCLGNDFVDNKCPGGSDNKCCRSAPFQEQSCSSQGGRCKDKAGCKGGKQEAGLCPKQPSAIKCCIGESGGEELGSGGTEESCNCPTATPGVGVLVEGAVEGATEAAGTAGGTEAGAGLPLNCPGGVTTNCNNGVCTQTCSDGGGGTSNNNNNNNGRRRKRLSGDACSCDCAMSGAGWESLALGTVCSCWGLAKSEAAAKADDARIQVYAASITAASKKFCIPEAIIMAVISRESAGGAALGKNGNNPGFGDNNNGFGLMQVDKRYHTIADTSNIDNIDQGTGILKNMLTEVETKHPTWNPAWQLRGAVAAYNFGAKNVQTQAGIDGGSASSCSPCEGNYSWDTVNRAKWFAGRVGGTATTSPADSDFGGKQDCYGQTRNGTKGFCEVESCCAGGQAESKLCMDYPSNTKCCFSSNQCGIGCKSGSCGAGVKDLACKILVLHEEKKISLKADHFDARGNNPYDGAASLSQIRDTCYGNRVALSSYGNAPGGCTCLKEKMLQTLHDFALKYYTQHKAPVQVNSLAGSSHSTGSAHYRGGTMDIGCKDVTSAAAQAQLCQDVVDFCKERGAQQVCHPKDNCGGGHSTWVHCQME